MLNKSHIVLRPSKLDGPALPPLIRNLWNTGRQFVIISISRTALIFRISILSTQSGFRIGLLIPLLCALYVVRAPNANFRAYRPSPETVLNHSSRLISCEKIYGKERISEYRLHSRNWSKDVFRTLKGTQPRLPFKALPFPPST